MVARSLGLANRNAGQQTPTALPSLLPPLLKVNAFAIGSVSDSPAAECLQTAEGDIARLEFRDYAHAVNLCELRQEAISALGRFAKRILDLLLASIAVLLLWPLMLVICSQSVASANGASKFQVPDL